MDESAEVLVVGAGLTGLATALFAAGHGADVLLAERHPNGSPHPRTATQHPRTMELLRTLGLADAVYLAGCAPADLPDTSAISPMPWGGAPQHELEPLLRARAEQAGARIRFSTELVSFEQDADGVTARLLDRWSERLHTVRARYLVAADGQRSHIRRELGIARPTRTVRNVIGITFAADLTGPLPHLVRAAGRGRYALDVDHHPEHGESILDYSTERAVEIVRDRLGAEVAPTILDIASWEVATGLAERFRAGRVFLAGDAAALAPAVDGLGVDTAIGDGADLGWKLGAVCTGTAGPALLDSYEAERRPYARAAVARACEDPIAPRLLDLVFGFRVRSDAVLPEDHLPQATEDPSAPSGRPGLRAPHVSLVHRGVPSSTVDLFGAGWVLLTGAGGGIWHSAAAHAAATLDLRLDAHGLGPDLADPTGTLTTRYGIGEAGASLVRPDGVVAWRSGYEVSDPAGMLLRVLRGLLDRPATIGVDDAFRRIRANQTLAR